MPVPRAGAFGIHRIPHTRKPQSTIAKRAAKTGIALQLITSASRHRGESRVPTPIRTSAPKEGDGFLDACLDGELNAGEGYFTEREPSLARPRAICPYCQQSARPSSSFRGRA